MDATHYDQLAQLEETHWWHRARQRILVDFLKRYFKKFGLTRRAKLLDIGCGTGKMLKLLSDISSPIGVDTNAKAVAYCRAKHAPRALVTNGRTLPFKKEAFDVVTAMEVLEHIKDDAAALKEWHRVLAPGGLLFLTCPAYQWMWGPADKFAHHYRRYTASQLRSVVTRAGFETVRVTYFNTLLFPGVALIRLLRKPFMALDAMSETDLERVFDFHIGPAWLGGLLKSIFTLETYLVRICNLPFGVSIIVLARKKP